MLDRVVTAQPACSLATYSAILKGLRVGLGGYHELQVPGLAWGPDGALLAGLRLWDRVSSIAVIASPQTVKPAKKEPYSSPMPLFVARDVARHREGSLQGDRVHRATGGKSDESVFRHQLIIPAHDEEQLRARRECELAHAAVPKIESSCGGELLYIADDG